jgi:hypothetical protein
MGNKLDREVTPMPTPIAILQHTPWWVFAIGALLVVRGVPALRTRSAPLARLLIVPAVFMAWGIGSLVFRATGAPMLVPVWLVCGIAGLAIGWLTTRLDEVVIDRVAGRVTLPGSVVPLLRNLTIFLVKYALGVAVALAPAWRNDIALCSIGVSGLSAGYFAAWVLRLALRYRAAGRLAVAVQLP